MIDKRHTLFSLSTVDLAGASTEPNNSMSNGASVSVVTEGAMRQQPKSIYRFKGKPVTARKRSALAGKSRLMLTMRASSDTLPRFRLTSRDREIVRAVYKFRALTTPQVEALLFPPEEGQDHLTKTTRCQFRLKLLYHAAYLIRDEQPQKLSEGRKPLVYSLDKRGAELVAELEGKPLEELDWDRRDNNLSQFFLDHLLSTNDVRVAICMAAENHAWDIATWLDDKTLKRQHMGEYVTIRSSQGKAQRATVVPDGYFVLNTGEYVYRHFLEVDRRTVTGEASDWGKRDWARKVRAYLEYYRSGQYEKRYQTKSLRILTVTTGEKRLKHLREITEKVGGKARFWFTTLDKTTSATVLTAAIWEIAGKDGLHSLTW